MRKTLMVVLALTVVLAVAMGSGGIVVGGKPIRTPVTGVTLNNATLYLDVGGTGTLEATVIPLDAFNQRVKWSTSDKAVAGLSGHGLTRTVTGVQAGNATVTVTTADGPFNATCSVIVQIPLTGIGNIIGSPVVGVTLSAGALGPAGATATYQWQRSDDGSTGWADIVGQTGNTYQLVEADWQKYIRVVATGYGYYKGTIWSNPTTQVKLPLTSIGAINGTTEVLETLTAGALTPAEATVTYQWQKSADNTTGWMPISGANSGTYDLAPADWQMYIRVSATGTGLYTGTVHSAPTGLITSTGIALTAIGDISGDPIVWETLYAGSLTPEGATADYQWQWSSDNVTFSDITGETSTSFSLNETAWQKYIRVAATGYGLYKDTVYSQPTGMVLMPLDYIYDPDEAPVVGVTLTAGDFWPINATVSYQWQSNNGTGWVDIAGATGNTYTVSGDDLGKSIQVTATGAGVYTGTVASGGIGPVTTEASLDYIAPIAGISMVGQTLTAGALSPKGATAAYQWQRSDDGYTYVDIEGANASTYQLVEADSGKYIQVAANGTGVYMGTVTANAEDGAVAVLGEPVSLPFVEDFSSYDWYSLLPAGWGYVYSPMIPDYDNMLYMSGTATAGGSSPELYFYYGDYETRYYDYRAITPAINTTGAISLALSFKHTHDFHRADLPYSIAVEVSTNGTDWDTVWEISPVTADIAAETVGPINLDSYAGETIYLSWHVYGYTWWSNSWAIDDVAMTGVTALTGIGPISGTPEVGQTLTAGNLTPPGATATYQWQSCATINGTYSDISGATSNTYDLIAADKDQYVRVSATGYGDYTGTVTSEPVSITGLPLYTVTFNETNSLSGVNIDIYLDGYGYLDYVTTNDTGQATIDLPNGNYTYFASKTGYASINDEEFVVSDSAQTINFTMSPAYTVTLSEANNLQYVYIEIFNSSEDKMGELETDASGSATIDLPNDTYDFYAYKNAYMDLEGNFTVSGANLTVPFEMIPCPIVTFNETNGLPGVYIGVYEDSALADFNTSFWTDSYGKAAMEIYEAGTYYYEAIAAGYGNLVGDFTVSVSNITEGFTMETGYYVDFTEVNSEMAILQLFSDSGHAVAASSPFVTDEYGNATIELANGTYYYRATRTGFNDCTGNFTVSSERLSVPFDVIPTDGVIFAEDFLGTDDGYLPYGWTTNASSLCHVTYSNRAGGYAPELELVWTGGQETYSDYYVATPPINATGISGALNLSFKSYFDLFMDYPGHPYTYAVQTSDDDGVTWTTVLEESPTFDTYPDGYFQRTENIDISACAGETFRICWRLYRCTYWMDAWLIDDVLVTTETGEPLTGIGPISGTPEVGQTLTAGNLTPPGATATYQWQSCATINGTYSDISGAISNTYDLIVADQDQYVRVSATGHGDYTGTVTSEPVLVAGLALYTVTFNVTNAFPGVSIAIYNDGYESMGFVTTNGTGQATIDLPNDTYRYYASKSGYAMVWDEFVVSDSAQTITFTMYVGYTVTFNETNGLGYVAINVYSDPGRTEGVCSLTTYSSGQGTAFLADGTYYYLAMKEPYVDLLGNFTVSGAPLTVNFEMNILFEEHFDEADLGSVPDGWTRSGNTSLMTVASTDNAGGTSPELRFSYGSAVTNETHSIYTPSINATGVTDALNLSFKHLHWYYTDETPPVTPPYSIAVEVSTDGGTTWGATSFAYNPTANIGPETVNVDLGAYKGYTINIRWSISGYTYWTDGWFIDDIIVSTS